MRLKLFLIPLVIFVTFNLYIIFNFGLYHDDWGFFVFNESFAKHSKDIWLTEGVELHRYPNVIFYIIGSLMPSKEFLYLYLAIFGLIICLQIYDILKLIFKKNKIISDLNKFGVLCLICCWYFYPFNIGGQIWSADLHVKVGFSLLLIHYQFLIREKLILSLIFLVFAFSSYEMFYLVYLPITFILFKLNLISKKVFKIYFIYSIIIQLFFILDRKRDYYEFEIFDFIIRNILNIFKFFYAIHSSFASFLNIYFQILIFLPFIYFISKINDKNNFFKLLFMIIITLGLNSLILAGGHYGFVGQGVFSRSFYYGATAIFLFTLIIFIFNKSKKIKLYFLTYIFLITFIPFSFESYSWLKSWKIQKEIIFNSKVDKINNNFLGKNLVIFFGPCKYNGVEIFYAPWDIGRSIRSVSYYSKNNFTPLTNWQVELDTANKVLGFHNFHYKYPLRFYNKIIFWDYFKNQKLLVFDAFKFNLSDVSKINSITEGRNCEIRSDYYKKNLIDYSNFKSGLSFFFQNSISS